MADLRWAIDKIDEPGAIGWYIFDTKTDTTICESMVLEPLETIIGLLAACEAMCNLIMVSGKEACRSRYGGSRSYEYLEEHWAGFVLNGCLKAWERGNAAIAKVKQDD